jgi:hypothetical protein
VAAPWGGCARCSRRVESCRNDRPSVLPLMACALVLSEGYGFGVGPGEVSSKYASKVVNLVKHNAGEPAIIGVLCALAVECAELDADGERAGDRDADVEEAQAPLVLLVLLLGLAHHDRVDQGDIRRAVRRADD